MLKKLTNNLGIKAVSLIISIILWMVAINITDPITQTSLTVPVSIINVKDNKYMEILDNTDQVRVHVRVKRSELSNISEKNIVAVADFDKMTEGGYIPIELSPQKQSDKIETIKSENDYVHVNVEDIVENSHFIVSEIIGQTAEGYVVYNATIDKTRVRIQGPESIVKKVKIVKAFIDVDGVSSDVKDYAELALYDADGALIEDERIKANPAEVSTTATIYLTKSVPVRYETSGSLPEGYLLDGDLEYNVDEVFVQGKPNVIKSLNEIVITDAIDLSELTKSDRILVDIKKYLPDGVSFVDSGYNGKTYVGVHVKEVVYDDDEDVDREEE